MTRARNTADTQTASGGPVSPSIAGKNLIINGAFDIWQRGTSITTSGAYTADRWAQVSGNSIVHSRSTDVPSSSGFSYSLSMAGTGTNINQRIESLQSSFVAGQTITLSFWYKSTVGSDALNYALYYANSADNFNAVTQIGSTQTISSPSTSWTRVVTTFTSISSNAANGLSLYINRSAAATSTTLITGVQIELGSVATPFSRAGGTIQGELAACQRYYFRTQTGTGTPYICNTVAGSSTTTYANLIHKVTMRSTPTSVEFSSIKWQAINNSGNITAASISDATPESTLFVCTTTGATAAQMNYVIGQTTSGYMAVNAEL